MKDNEMEEELHAKWDELIEQRNRLIEIYGKQWIQNEENKRDNMPILNFMLFKYKMCVSKKDLSIVEEKIDNIKDSLNKLEKS